MEDKLQSILDDYTSKINQAGSLADLDKLFLELFGKNGIVNLLPKEFSSLPKDELRTIGPLFNKVKTELENAIKEKRLKIKEIFYQSLTAESLDLTKPVEIKKREGHMHPISEFEQKIADLFLKIGFQQLNGPEIDSDKNNFELLNIPAEHPARDMWDTFFIDPGNIDSTPNKMLLRTHTSNSQIHIMKNFKPPFRMMVIGRCFRYENLDARHEHTFDQFEIVYVDKDLSLANLQYLSEYFLKAMLGEDIKARLSPGYYPFTEPSAHIFGTCVFCKGEGCKICGQTGELELAGAGMIHPNVLKNCGIDPEIYSGIAWGVGPGRMSMLKYDVPDVRLFNSGDLRFFNDLRKEKS
jgi:phenylalanyl-tRNA synthetase alpha chain